MSEKVCAWGRQIKVPCRKVADWGLKFRARVSLPGEFDARKQSILSLLSRFPKKIWQKRTDEDKRGNIAFLHFKWYECFADSVVKLLLFQVHRRYIFKNWKAILGWCVWSDKINDTNPFGDPSDITCLVIHINLFNLLNSIHDRQQFSGDSIGLRVVMQPALVAFFILWVSLLVDTTRANVNRRRNGPAQPCSPAICKLPSCRCSGTDIPGSLPKKEVPQIIMLSFDDAVNSQVYQRGSYHFCDCLSTMSSWVVSLCNSFEVAPAGPSEKWSFRYAKDFTM